MIINNKIHQKQWLKIPLVNAIFIWGTILLFLLSETSIQAQEGVQQRFYTSQNGLKVSWVHSINESQNNTLTMGHGAVFYLTRYDGYNFSFIKSPPIVFGKVFEDFSGSLWGIDSGNLNFLSYYSNNKWENLELDAGIPILPVPGIGNKILFLRDGAIREFDKTTLQTRIIKQNNESQIGLFYDMRAFQDGSIWITGENGVAKYVAHCDTCNSLGNWFDFPIPEGNELYHFTKPFEGKNGALTLMSKSNKSNKNILVEFNGKTWQKLFVSDSEEIYCGWRGHDQSLWIIKGSLPPLNGPLRDWDLFHVQQDQEIRVEKNRVLSNVLNDIVVEPDGTFWLATGSGIARFAPNLWRRQTVTPDLHRRFKKIHQDLSGRMCFAGEDAFSLFFNGKWELNHFNPPVFTGDICALKNGLLVVGISESGLALYNTNDKSCKVTFPFGNEMIRYYDQGKNGNCYIILQNKSGSSRLIKYNGEQTEVLAEDLKISGLAPGECEVTDIIETRNGDIWIVTFTEIISYKKGIRKHFDLKKEFEWALSTSVLELENGNIWISGSKGIIQFDGENWSIVQAPEFETARMMSISRDGSIWVASGTGVHRLIKGAWISNTLEDGLPNAVVFDILEDNDGKIWASTYNGIYCYFPESDTDSPETLIPADMNFAEALPSGGMQFVFEGYDKWDFTPSTRLLYSYRFDDNSWSAYKPKTTVMGVGLSAGEHDFEVRAMDRNGRVDPTPASWTFKVLLPWYKETFFILLVFIAFCIIILSLGFAVTRHLQVEKLVEIRTAELEETKERAEESDQLKSAFLANMSHEIRTPMNGILGFSSLLKQANLSGEDQQKYIGIIEKSGARMLNIINDIISISKIESGQMEVFLQKSNINEQIEYIHTFFKPEAEGKSILFTFKNGLPLNQANVQTDPEKLYAILTNLVKNALKYCEKGTIEFGYVKKGNFLEFFVEDTGIGIPKDRQQAIFERFIQADINDKMARQGAGLGLSISKAFVEILGGRIWVESEEGKGSVFSFTIPYLFQGKEILKSKTEDLNEEGAVKIEKLKILVAEDDENSCLLMKIMLDKITSEVLWASNGVEAVDICRNNSDIDMVLMDVQMPKMNGYKATKLIREFNKDVIIIAQTAYALQGDYEKALASGCDDYISKPIKESKLIQLIFKHISKK